MQALHFLDSRRWLLGDVPTWFLFEVVIRALLLYALLQVVLRLMGHRLASQMTIAELAVILTIGGAVVTPMLFPNIGLIAPILILLVALLFQWSMSRITQRDRKAEELTTGKVVVILKEGQLLLDALEQIGISHEKINSMLRIHGVKHLGEINRIYAEPSGDFSIYRARKEIPGLSVLPDFDLKMHLKESICHEHWSCAHCGLTKKSSQKPHLKCSSCQNKQWVEAVQ